MKIAFIMGAFFPRAGGAQVQAHNIANRLTKLGINIKLFLFNKTNIKNNSYEIIVLKKFIFNIVFFFKYYLNINITFLLHSYVLQLIKRHNVDVWHFNFLNFKSLILINILKKLNQKIIVTFQGIDLQVDKSINYGYRLNKKYDDYLRESLHKIDKFSYLSNTIKKDLIELGVAEEKIVYFPNCVVINKFQNIKVKKSTNNKFLNLITVARFSEKKKGFDLIQEICTKLLLKKIAFKWKIIGENTELLKSNKFIKSHLYLFDIIKNIENKDEEFFPHSNLITHYKTSDLYVNLSRIESFGITFVESLASEIPIISFDGKGANEIIIDKFNGFNISKNNTLEFANKILKISQKKLILDEMKYNCLESAKKFDLEVISNKLIGIYKDLS